MAEEKSYAELVAVGAFPSDRRDRLNLAALGIGGEGGEVVDIVKKWLFHGKELSYTHLREELGDLLWYLTLAANEIGATPQGLAFENILKLHDRYPDRYPDPVNEVVVRL